MTGRFKMHGRSHMIRMRACAVSACLPSAARGWPQLQPRESPQIGSEGVQPRCTPLRKPVFCSIRAAQASRTGRRGAAMDQLVTGAVVRREAPHRRCAGASRQSVASARCAEPCSLARVRWSSPPLTLMPLSRLSACEHSRLAGVRLSSSSLSVWRHRASRCPPRSSRLWRSVRAYSKARDYPVASAPALSACPQTE